MASIQRINYLARWYTFIYAYQYKIVNYIIIVATFPFAQFT